MKIKIKRQDTPESKPYWQTFDYNCDSTQTVAAILDQLNYRDDLTDENGDSCRRIRWECSCMQKLCGSCAMVINHVPALACGTFINPEQTQLLILEPLTKFPVISDLTIDRTSIYQHQKDALLYLGQMGVADAKEFPTQYQAAKCLKCGLCLEVCPNYTGNGNRFFGAVMANEAYLLHSSTKDRKKEIKKQYNRHFAAGCSQSLACRDICPMKIPTLSSIGYMNR